MDLVDDHFRRVTNELMEALDGYLDGGTTVESLHAAVAGAAAALDNEHQELKDLLEQLDPVLEETQFVAGGEAGLLKRLRLSHLREVLTAERTG